MRAWPLLAMLLLSACAANRAAVGPSYVVGSDPRDCAPFARTQSGLALYGAAADWWDEAGGTYAESHRPAPGAVLVFRRGGSLPDGHVAVVRELDGPRRILVDQANWVHHHLSRGEPVVDVSPRNDWSQVRVWWSPAGQLGTTVYPTYGFILPRQPMASADSGG